MISTDLTELRHDLHRHPELSGSERDTAQRIVSFLKNYPPSILIENLGGYGLAATYHFGSEGPRILIRAELDALPIRESQDQVPYASLYDGVSHKCGHDGHSTIVAGLAPWLSVANYRQGSVTLLFQSAEETGEGAQAIIQDSRWKDIAPDYAFALHNLPGYTSNNILLKSGPFTASVRSMVLHLLGKSSHAAEPEKGNNPSRAMAEILNRIDTWSVLDRDDAHYALVTPVFVRLGQKAYGTSAGDAEIHLTIRAWTMSQLKKVEGYVLEDVRSICVEYGLGLHHSFLESFASTMNDEKSIQVVSEVAKELSCQVEFLATPFPWGEDFGWFTQHCTGAMFGLGAGLDTPPLHHPEYDFPDTLIPAGVEMFQGILDRILVGHNG